MRCTATKGGRSRKMWCKFQDVFATWPTSGPGQAVTAMRRKRGDGDGGSSLPSQVTAQVQHVERKQKLSWLSHSRSLLSSLSSPPQVLFYSFYFSVALLHSLCLLDLPVSSSTQLVVARGRRRETTMGHEWTIVVLACLWCAQHTHARS